MDELIKALENTGLGNITLIGLVIIAAAIYFLFKAYKKFENMIVSHHKDEDEKERKIEESYRATQQYKEMREHDREQSREIQQQLTATIEGLAKQLGSTIEKLDSMDERIKGYELASTRSQLMQYYRYYADPSDNPMGAWTEMESEAFFELFKNYESLGGDGYMHKIVEPAMLALDIIPMTDSERISELMNSRK
ncbi:MAG: hypothetical protein NC548_46025 [Lachnospiraceae bacterium]|nr:hypothetical protein [Lachnospiraceae bacterium]